MSSDDNDQWIRQRFDQHGKLIEGVSDEVRRVKRRVGTMRNALRMTAETNHRMGHVLSELGTAIAGTTNKPGFAEKLRNLESWRRGVMRLVWIVVGAVAMAIVTHFAK